MLTSAALNHNFNFTNMDNTIVLPQELAEVIKTLPSLKELSYSPGTYRVEGFRTQVPKRLMVHRRKFQRVANKLYAVEAAKTEVKASDLIERLKLLKDKPVNAAKVVALLKTEETIRRPATPQEVVEYIRAEQRLTAWRLYDRAKDYTRTAKHKLQQSKAALRAAEMAKPYQDQADRYFDSAAKAKELALKYSWTE